MYTSQIPSIQATELLFRKIRYTGYILPVGDYIIAIERVWNDKTSSGNFDAHIFVREEDLQFVSHIISRSIEDKSLFDSEGDAGRWAINRIRELEK